MFIGVIEPSGPVDLFALCTLGRCWNPPPSWVKFIFEDPTVYCSANCSWLSLMWPKLEMPITAA